MDIKVSFFNEIMEVETSVGTYTVPLGHCIYNISVGDWLTVSSFFPDLNFSDYQKDANYILEKCFSEKDNEKKVQAYLWCDEQIKSHNGYSECITKPMVLPDGMVGMLDTYIVHSFSAILFLEAMYAIRYNIPIVKCPNCKQFFIGHHTGVLYCDRIFKNGKTCRQIGAKKQFADKVRANETLAKYEKIYQSLYYKKSKAKDAQEKAELTEKLTLLKENRIKFRNGEISDENFVDFLDEFSNTTN